MKIQQCYVQDILIQLDNENILVILLLHRALKEELENAGSYTLLTESMDAKNKLVWRFCRSPQTETLLAIS